VTGTPRREENFEDRAHNFAAHADKLASTAQTIAQSGGCNDRRTVEGIHSAAQQVDGSLCFTSISVGTAISRDFAAHPEGFCGGCLALSILKFIV